MTWPLLSLLGTRSTPSLLLGAVVGVLLLRVWGTAVPAGAAAGAAPAAASRDTCRQGDTGRQAERAGRQAGMEESSVQVVASDAEVQPTCDHQVDSSFASLILTLGQEDKRT